MLSVVLHVDEGSRVKLRKGRSWFSIAREAWGMDILRERSFLWLVASRLCILTGAALYPIMATFYLAQVFGLDEKAAGDTKLVLLGIVGVVRHVCRSCRRAGLSDRVGRKKVIYGSCLPGPSGWGMGAVAPVLPMALAGVAIFAGRRRRVPGGGLGADERHRPEGIDRPLHGHLQRGHGVGGDHRAGPGRSRGDGHGQPLLRLRNGAARRAHARRGPLHPGRSPVARRGEAREDTRRPGRSHSRSNCPGAPGTDLRAPGHPPVGVVVPFGEPSPRSREPARPASAAARAPVPRTRLGRPEASRSDPTDRRGVDRLWSEPHRRRATCRPDARRADCRRRAGVAGNRGRASASERASRCW